MSGLEINVTCVQIALSIFKKTYLIIMKPYSIHRLHQFLFMSTVNIVNKNGKFVSYCFFRELMKKVLYFYLFYQNENRKLKIGTLVDPQF